MHIEIEKMLMRCKQIGSEVEYSDIEKASLTTQISNEEFIKKYLAMDYLTISMGKGDYPLTSFVDCVQKSIRFNVSLDEVLALEIEILKASIPAPAKLEEFYLFKTDSYCDNKPRNRKERRHGRYS